MKIYFTLGSIPELAPLSPSERRMAYHACAKPAARHWQVYTGTAVGLFLAIGLGAAVLYGIHKWQPFPRLPTYFTGGFLCGGIIVGVTSYIRELFIAHYIRPHLREHLADRTTPAAAINPNG
jgi:hypothetical protein